MPYQFDQQNFYYPPSYVPPPNAAQPLPPPQNYILPAQHNFQDVVPPPQYQSYQLYQPPVNPQYQPYHLAVPPPPMMPPPPQARVLSDIQPNVRPQQLEVKPQADRQMVDKDFQYPTLLVSLADEYLDAAYASLDRSEDFFQLVATALGCLESTLNNFKLPPMREAQVSLKYTQVLFDETENYDEAEKVLTRATEVCDRNRFIDLKYAMQMLLARVLHKSRPKAAVKDVDGLIEEAEVYKHVAWEYGLRFLQASFALSSPSQHDLHNAITQFEKIGAVARQNGDYAIFAFAAIQEACTHLRTSNPESANSTQRALAAARQLQLNNDVAGNGQMQIMMEFIDLCCSLHEFSLSQVEQKIKALQQGLYEILEQPSWREDGIVRIPLSKRSLNGIAVQDGGVISEKNGKYFLTFSWLTKADVEVLGFMLSAISASHKNGADGGKAERFVAEGIERLRALNTQSSNTAGASSRLEEQLIRRRTLECHFLLEKVFLLCARGRWTAARDTLSEFGKVAQGLGKSCLADMRCIAQYLDGAIHQGTGDLSKALTIFQSSIFLLGPSKPTPESSSKKPSRPSQQSSRSHQSETIRSLSLLATINTAFIIHSPTHPQHHLLTDMMHTLDPLVHVSHNKHIHASYSLLLAILSDSSVLKQKQFLGNALSTAQSIGNAQITALTLVLMSEKFFKGAVGEQAVKCARAASHQCKRVGDPLWVGVSQRMEGDCFEVQGRREEAEKLKRDAAEILRQLPADVREV